MTTLKIDFSKLRRSSELIDTFKALERAFKKFNVDFYLVGALAREVWIRAIHQREVKRATSDIDFGILINNKETFDKLKAYLIQSEGFHALKNNKFRLIDKNSYEIDLIPFSNIEEKGMVTVRGAAFTSLNAEGFNEVFLYASEEIQFENMQDFKVCTLPGIVLLKLIAWDDRPEIRQDDLKDIAEIIEHFFDIYDEIIWTKHNDLFNELDENDNILIAARVLGREIKYIAATNDKLRNRLLSILSDKNEIIAGEFYRKAGIFQEKALKIINQIMLGINE